MKRTDSKEEDIKAASEIFFYPQFHQSLAHPEHGKKYQLYEVQHPPNSKIVLKGKLFPDLNTLVKWLSTSGLQKCWVYCPLTRLVVYSIPEKCSVIDYGQYIATKLHISALDFSCDESPLTSLRVIPMAIEEAKRQMAVDTKSKLDPTKCSFCNQTPGGKLGKCGKCEEAYYCNLECQKGHWPEHRTVCRQAVPINIELGTGMSGHGKYYDRN